ncbi:thr operon leader peptide [Prodigiosinella confusarubida]
MRYISLSTIIITTTGTISNGAG